MPHLIIEYSENLTGRHGVDIDDLVGAMHDAAIATGTAAPDALRTRAVERHHVAIADRHPDNAFAAVTVRLAAGRPLDELQRLINALADALEAALGSARDLTMVSVVAQEIDPDRRINRNHVRPLVAERAAAPHNNGEH